MAIPFDLGKAVGYLDIDYQSFTKGLTQASSKLSKFETETGQKLKNIGQKFTDLGSKMTTSLTLPIATLGGLSAKVAIDFEQSLAKVATIADQSVKPMSQIRDEVLQLSDEVNVSSNELNEALYQTISATNDTANAMAYLEIAAKLAKGGFTDTASAVDGMTSVLNAYGLSGEEAAQQVADLMIITQNLGKTTVNELNASLSQVIPTAASMNVSFEQVSAAMATITAQGTPTAQATTQLNALFAELGKQGTIANESLKAATEGTKYAGKSFQELMAQGVPLSELLLLISEEADDNGKSMVDMFSSIESGKAALQIINQEGTKFSNNLSKMEEAAGSTEAAFNTMAQTPQEKLKELTNKLTNLGITIGTTLLPGIEWLAQIVINLVTWFSSLDSVTQTLILTFAGVLAAIGPLTSLIGNVIILVDYLSTAWDVLNTVIKDNPIGAVITAIMALIAVGGLLYENCEWFRNFIDGLFTWFMEALNGVGQFFAGIGIWIGETASSIAKFFDDLGKGISKVWNDITTSVSNAVNDMVEYINGFIEDVAQWVDDVVTTITDIGTDIYEAGKSIITSLWDGMKEIWENITQWISDRIDEIAGFFGGIADSVGNFFGGLFGGGGGRNEETRGRSGSSSSTSNYSVVVNSDRKLDEYEINRQIKKTLRVIDGWAT